MIDLDLQVTVTGVKIQPASASEPALVLRTPDGSPPSQAPLELMSASVEDPDLGTVNEIFGWHYNRGGINPGEPVWSEVFESRRAEGAPAVEYLERYWDYQSLDRNVSLRPWSVRMDLSDHRMIETRIAKSWSILGYYDGEMSTQIYEFTTGDSDTEGGARFRRPLVLEAPGTQLTLRNGAETHRARFSMDDTDVHGAFELRAERYDAATDQPVSFSYLNLFSRRLELVADAGSPVGLSFRGSGTGSNDIALKLEAGSKVLQMVATNGEADPAQWTFDPSAGHVLAAGTVGVNTNNPGAFGGARGVLAIGNVQAAPSVDPVDGGVLYVEAGALKYRGSAGTVTTLAPA